MEKKPNSKEGSCTRPKFQSTTGSKVDLEVEGSLTEVSCLSRQISTEDTELSSPDTTVNVFLDKNAGCEKKTSAQSPCSGAVFLSGPHVSRTEQPLHSLLPASKANHGLPDVSQSFTSTKGLESLRTAHSDADASDICAAILLACLFCRPLDCLQGMFSGVNWCAWSMCSSLCSCEPAALPPLLDMNENCELCSSLGFVLCDCNDCGICLQAAECVDLAMEISQMLSH